MKRIQEEWNHEYNLTQWEYPISDNVRPATYDQFITQRDTLVTSNKYYADKAGRSLIIWTKLDGTPTDTIEIREPNIFSYNIKADWTMVDMGSEWKYVATWWHTSQNPFSCEIVKTGRYRIQHKEQFNDLSNITRVHSYVVWHKSDGTTQSLAVFDDERATQGEMIRLTAFWYREINLYKWDWLELKVEDGSWSIISSMAYDSNWWMVEYIDLAY